MLMLVTDAPEFCPRCGKRLHQDRREWAGHVSFVCLYCFLQYQLVSEEAALDAADVVGGDLRTTRRAY